MKNSRKLTEHVHARMPKLSLEELKTLVASGYDIESTDREGCTLVAYAVVDGRPEILAYLLSIGSNANAKDSKGLTPLHLAAIHEQAFAVDPLIRAGAEVNAVDGWGNNPLFRAVFYYKDDPTVIDKLLSHGAERKLANNYGVTPESLAHDIATSDVRKLFPL